MNVWDWFVDNKLPIHFGEDKTKCVLSSRENGIKSYGWILDANLNGESMTMKSLRKINTKLKLLHRQNEFLTPELRR